MPIFKNLILLNFSSAVGLAKAVLKKPKKNPKNSASEVPSNLDFHSRIRVKVIGIGGCIAE